MILISRKIFTERAVLSATRSLIRSCAACPVGYPILRAIRIPSSMCPGLTFRKNTASSRTWVVASRIWPADMTTDKVGLLFASGSREFRKIHHPYVHFSGFIHLTASIRETGADFCKRIPRDFRSFSGPAHSVYSAHSVCLLLPQDVEDYRESPTDPFKLTVRKVVLHFQRERKLKSLEGVQ